MRPTTVGDAGSAVSALRAAAGTTAPFDVMISDCQMPEVDGFTLARRVKREDRLGKDADRDVDVDGTVGRSGAPPQEQHRRVPDQAGQALRSSRSPRRGCSACRPGRAHGADRRANRLAAAPRRCSVLVAEDNPVNRKLVTTLLRKRGHKVKAVENGRKAVACVQSATGPAFDVVLMDLQMPEMGGFEAAQAIREWENAAVPSTPTATGRRLPIIALTAHAMQGDRERCLASRHGRLSVEANRRGRTDRDRREVRRRSAARKAPRRPPTRATTPSSTSARHCPTREAIAASSRTSIKLFRSDYPSALRGSSARFDAGTSKRSGLAAHGLKGAIATVGASAGRQAAAKIEQAAGSQSFEEAESAFIGLRDELERLEEAFAAADSVARPARRPTTSRTRRTPQRKRRPS